MEQSVRYDDDLRPRDWRGRVVPHRILVPVFMRLVPGMIQQFDAIPDEFWSEDVSESGDREAVVSCPCGDSPEVQFSLLRSCNCNRIFWFTGRDVRCANRPGQYADQPVDPDQDL